MNPQANKFSNINQYTKYCTVNNFTAKYKQAKSQINYEKQKLINLEVKLDKKLVAQNSTYIRYIQAMFKNKEPIYPRRQCKKDAFIVYLVCETSFLEVQDSLGKDIRVYLLRVWSCLKICHGSIQLAAQDDCNRQWCSS